MTNAEPDRHVSRHLRMSAPGAWMVRFQPLIRPGGSVLDLAAGGGRHTRFFLDAGHEVTALDRAVEPLAPFAGRAEVIEADLEDGSPWPLAGRTFDAVVVVNYLWRPLFPMLLDALAPAGVLIYETFARGNEAYSRPRNPDHLLRAGELLDLAQGRLQIVAYEHGIVEGDECPGVKQRISAVNDLGASTRDDGEPSPHPLSSR